MNTPRRPQPPLRRPQPPVSRPQPQANRPQSPASRPAPTQDQAGTSPEEAVSPAQVEAGAQVEPGAERVPSTERGSASLRDRVKQFSLKKQSAADTGSGTPAKDAAQDLTPITSGDLRPARVYQSGVAAPVDSLAERRTELRKENRRTILRKSAIVALVLALLAAAGYVVLGSSALALDETQAQISGQSSDVPLAEVEGVVASFHGTPLLLLDPSEVAHQISQITGVQSVTVTRQWPQGIGVVIVPREPVANVANDEGFAIVDAQGVVLATEAEGREGLPLVEIPLDDPQTEAALHAVLEVLGSLPAELLALTKVGEADHGGWVRLGLDGGKKVVWGVPGDNNLKAAVLNTLLQIDAGEYDVSSPLAPVTR